MTAWSEHISYSSELEELPEDEQKSIGEQLDQKVIDIVLHAEKIDLIDRDASKRAQKNIANRISFESNLGEKIRDQFIE